MEASETVRDFADLLETCELDGWLRASRAGYGFPSAEGVAWQNPTAAFEPPKQTRARPGGTAEWVEPAQEEARRIIKRQAASGLFPSQETIADEIADSFRKRTPPIHGTDGKPLAGATIKRHALKGISSATKKARATNIKRGN